MIKEIRKVEKNLLKQCRNSEDKEKAVHIIDEEEIHLKGLSDYYGLREK